MAYNKEAIYDEQIAPLIAQVLEIAKREGIQMMASFALMEADPNCDDDPMLCTSCMPGDTYTNKNIVNAVQLVLGKGVYTPHMTFGFAVRQVLGGDGKQ